MRRQVLVRMAVVGVLSGLLPTGGHADLFDTARQAVRIDLAFAMSSTSTPAEALNGRVSMMHSWATSPWGPL